MAAQEKTLSKKRGRPATGEGQTMGVRCHPPLLKKIDDWRRWQDDIPNRAEAIRRLVEAGLKASKPSRKRPKALVPYKKSPN